MGFLSLCILCHGSGHIFSLDHAIPLGQTLGFFPFLLCKVSCFTLLLKRNFWPLLTSSDSCYSTFKNLYYEEVTSLHQQSESSIQKTFHHEYHIYTYIFRILSFVVIIFVLTLSMYHVSSFYVYIKQHFMAFSLVTFTVQNPHWRYCYCPLNTFIFLLSFSMWSLFCLSSNLLNLHGVENWTQGLEHDKQVLFYRATSQTNLFI